MKIFFGGIIQGSNRGSDIHAQHYRFEIKDFIRRHYPKAEIFDPFEGHESSVGYDDSRARETFFTHLEFVRKADLLIAYLPQASLGTAIEMWEAYRHGVPILSISPMTTNWIIRLLPVRNFETAADFESFIIAGGINEIRHTRMGIMK